MQKNNNYYSYEKNSARRSSSKDAQNNPELREITRIEFYKHIYVFYGYYDKTNSTIENDVSNKIFQENSEREINILIPTLEYDIISVETTEHKLEKTTKELPRTIYAQLKADEEKYAKRKSKMKNGNK